MSASAHPPRRRSTRARARIRVHPRGRTSASTIALVLVAGVCMALVAGRASAERNAVNLLADHGVVAGTDTAPATAPTIAQLIGGAKLIAPGGAAMPLHTRGEPTILMISSRTCSWCKRALKDLGGMAGGRPLPRLTLLTLEGAAEGIPMLSHEQLSGARLLGPARETDRQRITARFPGTPTFVAIDRNGRVVRTLPGYPIPDELRHWYAVMVGEQEVP